MVSEGKYNLNKMNVYSLGYFYQYLVGFPTRNGIGYFKRKFELFRTVTILCSIYKCYDRHDCHN